MDMDPDPVAKPTQIMGKYFFFYQKYFISIQTKTNLVIMKKILYYAGDIEFGGGIICHTLTVLVSPSIEYYMSVLLLSINRLL